MTDPTPLLLAISLGAAVVAGWITPRRPLVAFGILFALASLSRATVETPVGTMRMEQPAIAVVGVVLLATGRMRVLASLPRWVWFVAGCLAVYLAVLAASSILVAPDRAASLRVLVWWAVSIAGGVVALVLVGQRGRAAILPLALVAALSGAIGIITAVAFLTTATPEDHLGIQNWDSILPRVYGLAWEANLYSSFLAACVPFGLEAARGRRDRRLGIAIAAVILVAMPLGGTRGAFIGLAVGLAVYLGTLLWRTRRPVPVAVMAGAAAALTIGGIVLSGVLLPNPLERLGEVAGTIPSAPPVGASAVPQGSTAPGDPAPVVTPIPSLPTPNDTISFRLQRVPLAFGDIPHSPLIGLGAESFGQRHADSSQAGAPDHIAILAVAAVYESGVIGALALAVAFAIVAVGLWRTSRRRRDAGAAAAYLGTLAALVAAYQATNALHFAINWMILGAAVALAAWPRDELDPGEADVAVVATPT
ncbi:MAG: hypothetical protein ACJ779_00050 [Chloroflexota bacterium]